MPTPNAAVVVQQAILLGDLDKPGMYVVRVKFPPHVMDAPHWHPNALGSGRSHRAAWVIARHQLCCSGPTTAQCSVARYAAISAISSVRKRFATSAIGATCAPARSPD
jgi:hypothetical protein